MKKTLVLILMLLPATALFSQRTWVETEVSKEIIKNLELSISPQMRFQEKFELDEYFFDTNLSYKISKYLDIGAGYRLGNNINKKGETKGFGRYNFDIQADYGWKNFQPKLRIRYTNADDFGEDNEVAKYLRYKLELEYKIKKTGLEPYVLYEWYHSLNVKEINKGRFETGLLYELTKHHSVSAFFRFHDYLKSNKESVKILGIKYKLDL